MRHKKVGQIFSSPGDPVVKTMHVPCQCFMPQFDNCKECFFFGEIMTEAVDRSWFASIPGPSEMHMVRDELQLACAGPGGGHTSRAAIHKT